MNKVKTENELIIENELEVVGLESSSCFSDPETIENGDIDVKVEESFDPENPDWTEEEQKEIENGLNWRLGVTPRVVILGTVVGTLCTFMLLKVILWNSANTPGFSLPSILIAFLLMKLINKIMGLFTKYQMLPMSKYELVCLQTLVVAIVSVSNGMGYGTYMAALMPNSIADYYEYTYEQIQQNKTILENLPSTTVEFTYWRMLLWALAMSFPAVNLVTFLRKLMIVHYKLPFPSPSATAVLINSFTGESSKLQDRKVNLFTLVSACFFAWALLCWLFQGTVYYLNGNTSSCSAFMLPLLGLGAAQYYWYFNFNAENMLYAGIACMTPRVVNFSTLVGSILFFGILLPIIFSFGAEVNAPTDPIPDGYWFTRCKGINYYSEMGGYGVFFMICCVLGNGLYVVVDMTKVTIMSIIERKNEKKESTNTEDDRSIEEIREEHLRIKIMEESTINKYFIGSVFIGTIALGLVAIPFLFPIKWYMVLIAYIIFPLISVMNVYLFGLTDQAITFLLAKGLIFMVGSWFYSVLGEQDSLPALMIFLGIIAFGSQNSADIMGDYKTAFILKASSTSMYICENIGLLIGCFVSPAVYLIFLSASPDMGFETSNYPVGYAPAYIGVGKIALEGFGALPKYAVHIGAVFFVLAFLAEPIRDYVVYHFVTEKKKRSLIFDFWPNFMVMGLYAYLGPGDYVIPTVIGWLSCELWKYKAKINASRYQSIVGAAIVVGVTIWGIPQTILSIAGVDSPMCLSAFPTLDGRLHEGNNDLNSFLKF
eukprot:Pgem_evm1s16602